MMLLDFLNREACPRSGAGPRPAAASQAASQAASVADNSGRRPERPPQAGGLPHLLFLAAVLAAPAWSQKTPLAQVVARPSARAIDLPGEFLPFLSVSLRARVPGYVDRVLVDRGSMVKRGQLLVEMSAPEMKTQIAEAESKVAAAEADRLQAMAQVAALQSTADRLKKASETPGAVAANELIQAQRQLEAVEALVRSREQAKRVATAEVQARKDMEAYLRIAAPFDGTVTERFTHPGALAGPSANDAALMTIEQISRLRLVVPVPEEDVGSMVRGAVVSFRVPAYPERAYSGTVARVAHTLDQKTRSMAVELDVPNRDGTLSPGMYPKVSWPVRSGRPALFVPKTSVVTTTERTFVIRSQNGRAQWVDVKKGAPDGDLIEVSGGLQAGDKVVRRATDELRNGQAL